MFYGEGWYARECQILTKIVSFYSYILFLGVKLSPEINSKCFTDVHYRSEQKYITVLMEFCANHSTYFTGFKHSHTSFTLYLPSILGTLIVVCLLKLCQQTPSWHSKWIYATFYKHSRTRIIHI